MERKLMSEKWESKVGVENSLNDSRSREAENQWEVEMKMSLGRDRER